MQESLKLDGFDWGERTTAISNSYRLKNGFNSKAKVSRGYPLPKHNSVVKKPPLVCAARIAAESMLERNHGKDWPISPARMVATVETGITSVARDP